MLLAIWRKRVRTVLYCTLKTWKVSPPFSRSRTAGPAAAYRAMFSVLQYPAPRTQHCSFCLCCCVSYLRGAQYCLSKTRGQSEIFDSFRRRPPELVVFSQRFVSLTSASELVIQVFQMEENSVGFTILSKAFKVREENFQNPSNRTLSKWISSGSSLSFRTIPGCFLHSKWNNCEVPSVSSFHWMLHWLWRKLLGESSSSIHCSAYFRCVSWKFDSLTSASERENSKCCK